MPHPRTPDRQMDVIVIAEEETQADRLRREVERIDAFDVDIRRVPDISTAAQLLETETFDAVIAVVPLSGGMGVEKLQSLDNYLLDLPVVAMTDQSDFESEHEALGMGVDEILYQQQFDADRLVRALSRARTRQQTNWTHRRMRRAVEHAQDGLVIADATIDDLPIVFCNRGFEQLTGYPEHEVLGRNCRFLQCSETSDDTVGQIRDALEREDPIKVVIRNEKRSGERFWNELAINPVENPDGNVTEFVGLQRDVTNRVETERELARKNNELQSYRTVVEHANDVIYFKDHGGRYRLVNKSLVELFDQSRDEILGSTDHALFDDETANAIQKSDDRVRQTGESHLVEWKLDLPDGPRSFLTSVFPDQLDGGKMGIVGIARDITELEPLDQQALYDHLTGLPKRDLFHDRLRRMIESTDARAKTFAVGIVDIDDFRTVNESLGHETGDMLLEEVADRLQSCLDLDGTIARLDSDRFGLLLEGVENRRELQQLAHRFKDVLEEPFETSDATVHLSSSIGFALPRNRTTRPKKLDQTIQQLMQTANDAMRRAKDSPGSSWRLLTSEHLRSVDNRIQLEHDMRVGIVHNQFEPHYQPIFKLDGRLHALEVLARWEHPERGTIPPCDFIPVAERVGLLDAITETLIEQTYASLWDSKLPADWPDPIRLNINLSPGQLARTDLPERIAELAAGPGADRTQLVVEITESQLLERADQIHRLSDRGVPIVVDDFGTGYSSLSRLKELPMEELKLDLAFVQGAVENNDDAAILRTVAELGRQLEVPVVGEGVETEEQLELLREIGCDAAQGYYLGRPAPFDDLLQQKGGADLARGNDVG